MKKLLTILILIISIKGICQENYFSGKKNYCTPQNENSKKRFDAVIKALQFPNLYDKATRAMVDVAAKDSTYCDAFFMAGYLFRLQEKHKEALTYYYVADSLAQNKSLEFKQNLAIEFMLFGAVDKARNKYEEMTKYFPTNPEGFYGIGNTAIILGDYDLGLKNLKIAEGLYEREGEVKSDVKYMFGILYALKEDYRYSLPYLEEVYSAYKKDDGYLALYALSMIINAKENKDASLEKKARKIYEKIKNSSKIDKELSDKLKSNFQ
ncbi:tetratricopeptide repeat protein [Chryseobacterium zhengzhouense]|uniref:Tetratricopeptide repeat protein n=1 Tax=Chryseobacterium zhengzhouense TaxID=1636086 RepID=A0ABW2M0R6_9FLAO